MQKLSRSISKNIRGVVYHRDDLEQIEALLHEVSEKITVSTDDCAFDSVEELCSMLPKELTVVKFSTMRNRESSNYPDDPKTNPPSFSVDIDGNRTHIWVSENTISGQGLVASAESIVIRLPKHWAENIWVRVAITLVWIIGCIIYTTGALLPQSAKLFGSLTPLYALFCFLYVATNLYWQLGKHKFIFPTRRSESHFWTKDNRDKVLIAVITGLFTFMLGLLSASFVKFLIPNHK